LTTANYYITPYSYPIKLIYVNQTSSGGNGTKMLSAWASMSMVEGLGFSGKVMNATNGAPIQGATVTIAQGGSQSYISEVDGAYALSGFIINTATTITTTLAGYTTDIITLTPTSNTAYVLNISLVPAPPTYPGSGILGVVRDSVLHNLVPGTTVTATNSTTTLSTITNIAGFYKFDNLVSGAQYDIYGIKVAYGNSSIVTVTVP
jgi:hypothetical protein